MSILRWLCFNTIFAIMILGLTTLALFAENNDQNNYEDMVKGESDAKVTIVEYASFTCPHCATFHKEVFPDLKKQYIDTGKVRFIYREVYFDAPGLWAGLLARCVNTKKYFGVVDLLYRKQSKWASASTEQEVLKELFSIGRQVGLKNEEINQCVQNKEKSLKMIDAYLANSKLDQITSTPSLVVNGKLFKNTDFDDLKVELDKILN
jgi:protein-disulfide isomerase